LSGIDVNATRTSARQHVDHHRMPLRTVTPVSGYLFYLIYDLSPARLGRGGRRVTLTCGCPRLLGVTLIWHVPAGHRGKEWLKRGLPSSK
jgi:hypothetical protein